MSNDILTQSDLEELQSMLMQSDDVDEPKGELCKTAERVSYFDNIGIYIRSESTVHKKPHFHVYINSVQTASFSIDPVEILEGNLKNKIQKTIIKWAQSRTEKLMQAWNKVHTGEKPKKFAEYTFNLDVQQNKKPTYADAYEVTKRVIVFNSEEFLNKIRSETKYYLKGRGASDSAATTLADSIFKNGSRLIDMLTDDPFDFDFITRAKQDLEKLTESSE